MGNKKNGKGFRNIVFLLAVAIWLAASLEATASQTSSELKKAGQKIDELEGQKEHVKEQVGSLKEQENHLQGELADLNQQMSDVSAQINDLEAQISEKQTEIEVTGQNLDQAQETKEQQYASMKARIQFIYEKGGLDFAAALLGSSSMSDFLNKAEYVEELNRYDRQMLDHYTQTCRQIKEQKKALKQEKKELLALQESMEQKKAEVDGLIVKTQQSIQVKQDEISDANEALRNYEAQISKMKAYEEELERKKAQEAKKRAEEQKKAAAAAAKQAEQSKQAAQSEEGGQKKPSGSQQAPSGGGTVTAQGSDLAMLAALVECEAGGESYEGKWAVASVVVNRVRSGSFPNTISGVIYQSGQFSPVASGRFAMALSTGASASCTQAASAALSGSTNVSCLYFCRASSGVQGTVIGNHVFY